MTAIELPPELLERFARLERARDGAARQALWQARDGWIVGYTTSRIVGGPPELEGRFATLTYRPIGDGSRSGKPSSWRLAKTTPASTRKTARARAVRLYERHDRPA